MIKSLRVILNVIAYIVICSLLIYLGLLCFQVALLILLLVAECCIAMAEGFIAILSLEKAKICVSFIVGTVIGIYVYLAVHVKNKEEENNDTR